MSRTPLLRMIRKALGAPQLRQQMTAAGYPTLYNRYNAAGYALDHMSVHEWIERYAPGGHQSEIGELMDVAVNTEYGLDTSQLSALNMVYYGTGDECFDIAAGSQALPTAIAQALPAGASCWDGCSHPSSPTPMARSR